ncbi:G-type lectin S-receptor-like serine/threonine-protein kinase LECRK3 [Dendrobium catenatum]|uniref:Receptor-like serine/threonine-protein kinase n=1 Tax=Dendrobium catenatum TaxID=906689 RepID=A0A2I0WUZ0_9ASPA|nr:G-type lectin S-receptor-like serine/threonine-protein kinase LECRK3 [Dendrobium catenatum]PKU79443.1 G-type lectin S-receptor-like serine/threonine-protein kinase RLK1 [Dendrobium catenatum]
MEYPSFFLLLLLTIIAFIAVAGQPHNNITLSSYLTTDTAGVTDLSWLSPSGNFAFGFLPLPTNTSLFLLAIWFANLPNTTTLIWTPNRHRPLPPKSSVFLTSDDGQLSLRDPTGTEVWNPGAPEASYAAMLDTGDFVLAASDGSVLWNSFSDPTDTILPTQTLSPGTEIVAKLSDDDFSNGRFKLRMQSDGNLVFYQIAIPTGYQYSPYWAANFLVPNSRLVFNASGSIDLISPSGSVLSTLTSATTKSSSDYYHRGTLDYDGVFRHYVYPKKTVVAGGAAEWLLMDFSPIDICQNLITTPGSGACGFNSYCSYDTKQMVACQCPVGYSWVDPNRTYMGCKPNFTMPSCISRVPGEGFQMVRIEKLDFPTENYDQFNPMNETDCEQQCLDDCLCAASVYDGVGNCYKKKFPFSNGRKGNYVSGVAFIKVSNNNNLPSSPLSKKRTWILPDSIVLVSSVVLNFIIVSVTLIYFHVSKRKQKHQLNDNVLGPNLKAFTYKELQEATKGFSEELGRGACGTVYTGYLCPELTGTPNLAVKQLRDFHPDIDKEFTNEVKSIGETQHKNLVRLLGYCNQDTKRLLVYEYMSKGSLASYLFSKIRPPWKQRVEIMLGIARGLRYLHEECTTQIIHCDIKPQNVLLDENFNPRVSDFGLAKLLKTDQTRTNTGIRGTKGYVAPEWFRNSVISAKVDVYSFGVMVMEILFCRRNVENEMEEEKALLTFWVSDCYNDGRIDALLEGDEEAMADMGRVERFLMVALWCVQEEPALRPTMGQVMQMLEGAVAINPVPPSL